MLFIASSVAIKTSWFRGIQISTNIFTISAPSPEEALKAAKEINLKVFPLADGYKSHQTSVYDLMVILESHYDKMMGVST